VGTKNSSVFISYASEDLEAGRRIANALTAAGIQVWLDQSELRGGDAWDRQIREQINECTLFIPIISANAHARIEGYFRFEWKLAIDRSYRMAPDQPFLLPVVTDDTPQADKRIPDRLRELQWTRAPSGDAPSAFIDRVRRLLSPLESEVSIVPRQPIRSATAPSSLKLGRFDRTKLIAVTIAVAVALAAAAAYLAYERAGALRHSATPPTAANAPLSEAPASFNPPPHSIAVLPFLNMSGDKEQEYFADGLTEELLNSLSEIDDLQVAARTSAFSFKGTNTDISTIARKLNVGTVLEGSVRRSGNTVRITAQLINAVTGFHLWSHSYDRSLTDMLRLQTEIAAAVASALKVTLLGDVATKIELGGTRNPAAFDAYLRGRKAHLTAHNDKDIQTAITALTEAIELDPSFALAYANRSIAFTNHAMDVSGAAIRENLDKAVFDASKAIALAPDLAEGHLSLGLCFLTGSRNVARASEEYERALVLAPGNARILREYGRLAVLMGRTAAGFAAARRAVVLDPLNRLSHFDLGRALYLGRQPNEAIAALQGALALDPADQKTYALRGLAYYALGDLKHARASCEIQPDDEDIQVCLAVTYEKLGRHADAENMFAKLQAPLGDKMAYLHAEIYAQWGDIPRALDWLETALRLHDPALGQLKVDPLLDPLRQESRFQAIVRELKFPN
jgi:TolB-like protein/cytochrome c-type biogenesis protein CcmH/NrfG